MPNETPETSSPAPKSDANGSQSVSAAQAVQRLMSLATESAAQSAPENAQPTQAAEPPKSDAGEAQSPAAESQTEAAPTEAAKETAPAEGEGETDVLSHHSPLTPELRDKIQKRIDKEVAKRGLLERELADLKQKLESVPAAQPPPPIVPLPSGAPILANITDVNGLVQLQQQAKEAVRWAEEQLDREDIDQGVQLEGKTLTKQDIKGIMRNAKLTLEDHIPQRYNFLVARQQSYAKAAEQFPWMKDKTSPEYVEAQNAYRQYPWLANLPDADFVVGVQIEGMKALKARAEAKPPAKPVVKPSSKPSSDQAAPPASVSESPRAPASSEAHKQVRAAMEQLRARKGISGREAAAFLLKRELSQTR